MDDSAATESVPQSESGQPAPIDTDLPCPHCDYNLRGLTENRCPECGGDFDRQRLVRWCTERDLPLSFTRSEPTDSDGLLLTLTNPARLAREMPPMAFKGNATAFGWVMRGLGAFIIFVVAAVLANASEAAGWALLFSIGPIAGTLFCEAIIALLLARLVEPVAVPPQNRYRFWSTICICFSSYFPISCGVVPLLIRAIIDVADSLLRSSPSARIYAPLAIMAAPVLMILWWWLALARAVAARGRASSGRTAVIWLIPAVGLLSVIVGVAVDFVLALLLRALLD